MNRILKGLKIYLEGNIELKHQDKELIVFNTPGSKGETYQQGIYDNYVICDCDDWQRRHKQERGSYICKHLWAAFFKLASMNGFVNLKNIDLKDYFSKLDKADENLLKALKQVEEGI